MSEVSSTKSSNGGGAELELRLSLGARKSGGGGGRSPKGGEYCRILTAEDFPAIVSRASPISSSSSSSGSTSPPGGGAAKAPANPISQVVGWPPVRAYRMNNLFSHSKDNNANGENTAYKGSSGNNKPKEVVNQEMKRASCGASLLVKVNMDGDLIGRKIDLGFHQSYESLALTLETMFTGQPSKGIMATNLLDGSSEFSLTYMDKDGDWMLVGDVPWGMFVRAVKRLRIMKTADSNVLSPRSRQS